MIGSSPVPRRVFRFAPSPNGLLHLGHAYSALMNQRNAARCGGRLLLRIEDIDRERCRPAFETAIVHDLRWLGFDWTPPIVRQSERFAAYGAELDRLDRMGLLYPCFCSRGDIAGVVATRPDWPRDPDGAPLYPGTCRHLSRAERSARKSAGVPASRRLDMTAALRTGPEPLAWLDYREGETPTLMEAKPEAWGDVLLARKDVPASYHVAVVTDDEAQGVTDVVRGEDLLPATSLHRLLQALLGFRKPAYHHHRLILDAAGRKLSKSLSAPALSTLREAGVTAAAVREQLDVAAR